MPRLSGGIFIVDGLVKATISEAKTMHKINTTQMTMTNTVKAFFSVNIFISLPSSHSYEFSIIELTIERVVQNTDSAYQ
jgi:hypothetical protein